MVESLRFATRSRAIRSLLLQTVLLISLGAIVGANLRFFLAQYVGKIIPGGFPYGTLVINVTGSLILGFFMILTAEKLLVDPRWRLVIAIGFCGGYTTYSSFAFETFALFEQGQFLASSMNIVATNVLCLMGVALGAVLARMI